MKPTGKIMISEDDVLRVFDLLNEQYCQLHFKNDQQKYKVLYTSVRITSI